MFDVNKVCLLSCTRRKKSLYAESVVRPTNVHLLRGLIQLGRLLSANPDIKDAMSARDVFHTYVTLTLTLTLTPKITPKVTPKVTLPLCLFVMIHLFVFFYHYSDT